MGEDETKSLGVNTGQVRAIVIVACTILTAASVSISGIIGGVGLVIPHVTRMIVGPDHKMI